MKIPAIPRDRWSVDLAIQSGHARVHFSYLGEDVILWHLFGEKRGGFYVDVGAHHPDRYSNTALLHRFNGWRGINIDPDERAIEIFNSTRKTDVNVCCAVAQNDGYMPMAFFEDWTTNTLNMDMAKRQAARKAISGTRDVRVRPLRSLLEEFLPSGTTVDLLNVDAEGADLDVLQSNDWSKFKPDVVLVETHGFDLSAVQANSTFCYLSERGYRLFSHVVATSIYRRLR